ncbi:MAG: hypothetical protein RLZ26_2293 [Pseudomonadota bacterium]|jgi:hypothetical protein
MGRAARRLPPAPSRTPTHPEGALAPRARKRKGDRHTPVARKAPASRGDARVMPHPPPHTPPAPLALSWHRLRGGRLRHRAVPYPPTQGAPGIPQATSPNRGRGPTSPFPLVRWSRATAPTTSTGSRHPARPAHPRARGLPILGAEPARGRTRRHHGCPPSGTARAHAEGYGCVIARGGGRSRRGSALPGRPSGGVAAGSGRCARGGAPRVAPLPERRGRRVA